MLFLVAIPILFSACGRGGPILPAATGTRYELLIVMDHEFWRAPVGRALFDVFDRNMEALPQPEPMMNINQCRNADFSDLLKPSRNILLTEISPRFDEAKVVYARNRWSNPQSVAQITAPNDSVFMAFIQEKGEEILNFFLTTERNRQIDFLKSITNNNAKRQIEEMFGIQIDIPRELTHITTGKDFFWITNSHANHRMDMVIYSYPYTDRNTFTPEYLIAKRDSFMKANIPGEFEGSFMGTEVRHHFPVFRAFNLNNTYCMEMRGLWRMFNGGSMGGPFYSHTRVDEINNRVITVEGFVFAPGKRKRNYIRLLEASVFTVKLPQEINVIEEVTVVSSNKQ